MRPSPALRSAALVLRPVPSADHKLHQLIRKQAEIMLAELPTASTLTQRICELVTAELAGGNPSLSHTAKRCGVSERTLGRQLEEENTTFRALLEDLRRRFSLRYVRSSGLPLTEIAFLVGLFQPSAFHRAFRRWTTVTGARALIRDVVGPIEQQYFAARP